MRAALVDAPRRRGARSALPMILCGLAALLLILLPARVEAQTIFTVDSTLCDSATSGCGLVTVPVGQLVHYEITVTSLSGPGTTISISDTFAPGFIFSGIVCGGVVQPLAATVSGLSLPAGGTVTCRFIGAFGAGSTTNAMNLVVVRNLANNVEESDSLQSAVDLAAPLPSDLSIDKSAAPGAVDLSTGSTTVVFTIRIRNLGQKDVLLRDLLTVQDRLRLMSQSVVLHATFVSAACKVVTAATNVGLPPSDCLDPAPIYPNSSAPPFLVASTAPVDFLAWRYSQTVPGLLRVGDEMVLEVTVQLSAVPGADCILAPDSDGLINGADIVLTLPASGGPATALAESSASGNPSLNNSDEASVDADTGATVVNPHCNAAYGPEKLPLQIIKIQVTPTPAGGFAWGSVVRYRITVKNVAPGTVVNNIKVADLVQAGVGTPPFTATIISATCPFPAWLNICLNQVMANPAAQPIQGYSDIRQMFAARLSIWGGLSAPHSTSFEVYVRYSDPQCDSYPGVDRKPIHNIGLVTGWTQNVGTGPLTQETKTISASVTTLMAPLPKCPLTVTKKTKALQIHFGMPTTYTVTFTNPDPDHGFTMGTLIDTMRLAANPAGNPLPYALQLPVSYRYTCAVGPGTGTVTGYPQHNPSGPAGSDSVLVTATQLPQQGVRLIQNSGPVVFEKDSSLVCTVTVTVQRPAESDPYCTTGILENAAILDGSAFYAPNAAWPTGTMPGMWARTRTELPRCLNLVVNKEVKPSWTWQGGGPLTWTMSVLNTGRPLILDQTFTGIGPFISDTFSAGPPASPVTVTAWTKSCTPIGNCDVAWQPAPPANPSRLRLKVLPTGHSASAGFTVAQAPAAVGAGGEVCNTAQALMLGPPVLGIANQYYWKHPDPNSNTYTLRAKACAKVLAVGSIRVTKMVRNNTGSGSGIILPPNHPFDVTVSCTYPPDLTGVVIADVGRTLNGAATTLVEHIPVGSVCTVKEAPPPVPPATLKCVPVWQTGYSASVTVPELPAIPVLTVTNTLTCRPSTLLIVKTIDRPGNLAPPPEFVWFLVDCGAPNVWKVKVSTYGIATSVDVPAPVSCTVIEYVPPSETAGGLYTVMQTPPVPVTTVVGGSVKVETHNKLRYPIGTAFTLLIRKLVRINGVSPPVSPVLLPFASAFAVEITCAGHPPVRVSLEGIPSPTGTVYERAVGPYPPGTQCVIREVSRSAPLGCAWVAPYPAAQSAVIGPVQVVRDVVNSAKCPP